MTGKVTRMDVWSAALTAAAGILSAPLLFWTGELVSGFWALAAAVWSFDSLLMRISARRVQNAPEPPARVDMTAFKASYSDADQARIREEMKSVGLKARDDSAAAGLT